MHFVTKKNCEGMKKTTRCKTTQIRSLMGHRAVCTMMRGLE